MFIHINEAEITKQKWLSQNYLEVTYNASQHFNLNNNYDLFSASVRHSSMCDELFFLVKGTPQLQLQWQVLSVLWVYSVSTQYSVHAGNWKPEW